MVKNHVKTFRLRAGLTLAQLGERSGVPVSTLHDIEQGAEPRVLTAIYIARALGIRVESLWPV